MGGRDLFNVPMNLCRVIKCNAVDDTGRRSAEFAVVGEEIKTLAVLAAFGALTLHWGESMIAIWVSASVSRFPDRTF